MKRPSRPKRTKSPRRLSPSSPKLSLKPFQIPVEKLRWRCDPKQLDLSGTGTINAQNAIIGQDRALRALRLGLEVHHSGYNIFVTGLSGTGRMTAIKRMLREYETGAVSLSDICYVHNFHDADAPLMLSLPAGQAVQFKREMASLVADLQRVIPGVFESRRYAQQRKVMLEHFQDRQRSILRDFERKVKDKGFEVVQSQASPSSRPEIAYMVDDAPVGLEQIQAKADAGEIPTDERNRILGVAAELEGQMDVVMREMRNIERKAKKSIDDLNTKLVEPEVDELLEEIRTRYPLPRVQEYLKEVRKSIVGNFSRFHQKEESAAVSVLGLPTQKEEDGFLEYQVNVIVDNGGAKGPPVIIEANPRFKNLFGTIDRVIDRHGVWRTNFLQIKAGSLVAANGGFLVVNAVDALSEPGVWMMLKRVLRNKEVEIQPIESGLFGASSALKPEPIKLDVKLILVGDAYIHSLLYQLDEDFQKVFKVRADFDTEMPNTEKSIESYASFIKSLCETDTLLPLDASAVAEITEEGARLAGRQNRLSTRFSILADVLREADYWARTREANTITSDDIRRSVMQRLDRVKMIEDKIQEMIEDGSLMIQTEGTAVGQVNGLSVYQLNEFEFGRPTRITARTGMGRAGIINIERESDLSGPTHDKGVLILTGYLLGKFASRKPLVLSASIAFEQSYSGVDGDSASSTEVYALLSSLSGIPLRQDIAVTGSVNQHGEIQPIGGVNLKIEGFFDVCRAKGLTGKQGVLIPHQNVSELMLRHDVVDAVSNGKFHIYAVQTIDEGVEILTGRPSGKQTKSGKFLPRNSVSALVDAKLSSLTKHSGKH
ncbi:MAG: ATP-binding protein [Bacteroidota bacterium]